MSLESGDFITDLVPTNPTSTDPVSQGDDHLQLIKRCVQQSFPNINAPVTLTSAEINALPGQVATLIPAGTILDFAGDAVPVGFLLCNGVSYTTAGQPALFAAIGYLWGGAGANFNVPDLRRRTTMGSFGVDLSGIPTTVGSVGGAETHVLTTPEMPTHAHDFIIGATGSGIAYPQFINPGNPFSTSTTEAAGGGLAHNNMQPSAVVLKIIKT